MTSGDRSRHPVDRVVRRPRQRQLEPVRVLTHPRPSIVLSASAYALLSLTLGFALLISLGTVALMLPPASVEPGAAPFITALFTATSAVCVTGLVVETTGKYWSYFGQSIILVLMFVGGLGLMTATMSILVIVGRHVPLNARLAVRETLAGTSLASVLKVSRYILLFAVVTQAMGFGALFITFMAIYPRDLAAWSALFHSVSAFNNAGFDIFTESSSLVAYHDYYPLVIIIGILIALGGLSFPVLAELWRVRRVSRWTLDTRLVIHGSLFLWALGILVVLIFEWNNSITLGGMTLPGKLINAWFQSVTARTAGFSTIDFSATSAGNDFVFLLLMFIGGASGSTAAGIKVNTIMVLVVAGLSSIQGRQRAEYGSRRLAYAQVIRAIAVTLLALVALLVFVAALLVTESAYLEAGRFDFLDVLFEVVSGFNTVGLSRGITSDLTDPGKLVITTAMYVGRLGPLTIATGLALRERRLVYGFPEESVRIG